MRSRLVGILAAVHGHGDQDLHGYTRRCQGPPSTLSHTSRGCLIRVGLWRSRSGRGTRWKIRWRRRGWGLGPWVSSLVTSTQQLGTSIHFGEGHSSFIQAYSLAETPIPNE